MANWITRAFGAVLPKREATYGPTDDFWYGPVDQANYSGVSLSPGASLAVAAVYGCTRVLKDSLGSLPFKPYRWKTDKEKEPARDHPLWRLLQQRPNGWMTPQEWKEMGVMHLVMRGNFYCRIVGTGMQMQLLPLSPDRMEVKQKDNGELVYIYHEVGKADATYRQEDILHVRGLTLNGVVGVSVLEFARNSIASSITQEKHGATLVGKGAVPPFWIKRPAARRWTDVARKEFRKNWRSLHGGADNAANPPILGDDMEIHALQISNRDMQFIEGREFSAQEICGFFGVHPALMFKSKETAGNNEEISQQFKTYTLGPLAIRFEQAVDRDLLDDSEREEYFTRFNLDALTRATMKDRYEAHNIAVQGGWKTVNEVRDLEDLNPIDGGDESRFPLNMQPAGGGPDRNEQGGQPGKGQPKAPATEEPDDEHPPQPRRKQRTAETDEAFRVLLTEAAGRIASAEINWLTARADRAAEDRDLFNEWAKGVYTRLDQYMAKTLEPISLAWQLQSGVTVSAKTVSAAIVPHMRPVFDAAVDVPSLLESWKTTRAGELATTLEEVFFGDRTE